MQLKTLSGVWEFRQVGSIDWQPAIVPGGVHTDLMAAGMIQNPFVADNEKRVQWVAESDWEYRTRFTCSSELLNEDQVWLVCDGLDTLARVMLNGQVLGHTENMFRQYRWEVKALLQHPYDPVENEILITFNSPVKYTAERQAIRELFGVPQAIPGGPYLRKAPCQFGWDWGPMLPPLGIWKDIRLESYSDARIEEIHLRQRHVQGRVTIEARLGIQQWSDEQLTAELHITEPDGGVLEAAADIISTPIKEGDREGVLSVLIPQPELWWPNGYGEQPLYEVEVSLRSNRTPDKPLDVRFYQIGLRTIELRQEPDAWGRSFVFLVNGIPIFAKGSNWIPADSFPTRITYEHLESLLRAAADTHQNMLRVWGGGFYEDERFYDLCDRYGLLVWQDFIFSCSVYPLDDPTFLENVRMEVLENIRRLRHRSSLALWCGNNEMEEGWTAWGWMRPDYQDMKDAYDKFFHHTLKDWCTAEDPDHAYWPSSPSSDIPFQNPNGQQQGDAHYWDVWHGRKPFTAYRQQFPRFMSEFGFQALPPLETIRSYADEADWNMTSYIMEHHQRSASGNELMVAQMLDTFQLPKDFTSLVYLSMALQAEGIRYGVEHWRRHPERVAGTIYWQLNDCWPVASWSSLDYFGRWKALHYIARRFFAPLLLSIEDNPPKQNVYVTNDRRETWQGSLRWSLETLDGQALDSGAALVSVNPQSALQVCSLDFSGQVNDDNRRNLVFITELWQDDQRIALQTASFVPIKHLRLADPELTVETRVEQGQLWIELAAQRLALLLECSLVGTEVVFSDNYFNLPAGRIIQIACPMPAGWTLEQAQKSLKLRSIFDSYTHGGL